MTTPKNPAVARTLRELILNTAVQLARAKPYHQITRQEVSLAAGCGSGTINFHFHSMGGLWNEVVAYAVKHEVLEIVAMALMNRHPIATTDAPSSLKRRALSAVTPAE